MKTTVLFLGTCLTMALFNTALSATEENSDQDSLNFEEPNENNDNDLHPVNFYLTSNDEQSVINTLICRGWPCPKFHVKKDHTAFVQERVYESFDIVSATTYGCGNFSAGLLSGYAALFRYRKGLNSENRTVNMSVPVVVEVSEEGITECKTKYKVYVFATESSTRLPQAVEKNVQKDRMEKMDVFVRTYTGVSKDETHELVKLQDDVHNLNLCFNPARYMVAMYDPPWKTKGRRNEIWIEAKDCE